MFLFSKWFLLSQDQKTLKNQFNPGPPCILISESLLCFKWSCFLIFTIVHSIKDSDEFVYDHVEWIVILLQTFKPLSRTSTVGVRHTLTGDSSIFRVGAIMYANWIRGAVYNSCFITSAPHLVQEDGSSSLAKEGLGTSNYTWDHMWYKSH